ncbi:hypothetical protein DFH27DRAFT_128309 [Peziza echinospora]|nr:hypothetical protein DFH27DRAFT_128309 [Peziza echinospora]
MATTFPGRQPGGGPGYFPQKQNICFSFRDQGKCSKSFCPYLHCLDDSQRNQGVKQQDNIPQQPQYGNKQFSPQGPHIQPVVPQQGPQMPVQSYGHYPQGNQPIGFGVMAAPGRIILLDPAQVPGLFQSHMGNHSGYMGAPINHMGMGSNNQHTRYEQSPVWDNRPQAYQVHNSQPQQPSQFHNQNFAQGPQHHAPSQPQQELYGTYPNSSPTASNFSSHTNNSPQNYPPQNQARTYPTRNTDGVPTEPRNFQQNNHGYKPRYNNRFPRPWENRYPQPVPAQGAQTEPNASTDANPVPLVKPSPIKDIKPAPVPVVEPVPAQEVNPDLARRVQPPPRPIVQEDLIDLLSSSPPEHVKDDKPSSDKTTQVEIHSISRGSSSLSEMNSLMLPPTETVEKKPGTGLSGLKERIQLISSSQQASMKVSPALTELSPTALETYINTPPHLRGKLYPELLQRSRLDQDSVKVSSTDLSEDNDKFTTQAQITTAPTSVTQVDCTTTESNHLSSTVELSENAPSTITSSLMDLKTLDISHSPPTSDNEPSSISQEEAQRRARRGFGEGRRCD